MGRLPNGDGRYRESLRREPHTVAQWSGSNGPSTAGNLLGSSVAGAVVRDQVREPSGSLDIAFGAPDAPALLGSVLHQQVGALELQGAAVLERTSSNCPRLVFGRFGPVHPRRCRRSRSRKGREGRAAPPATARVNDQRRGTQRCNIARSDASVTGLASTSSMPAS